MVYTFVHLYVWRDTKILLQLVLEHVVKISAGLLDVNMIYFKTAVEDQLCLFSDTPSQPEGFTLHLLSTYLRLRLPGSLTKALEQTLDRGWCQKKNSP